MKAVKSGSRADMNSEYVGCVSRSNVFFRVISPENGKENYRSEFESSTTGRLSNIGPALVYRIIQVFSFIQSKG